MIRAFSAGRRARMSGPQASFAYDFTLNPILPAGANYTRASAALYYDENGALVSVSDDTPRFAYDVISGAKLGLLLEEAVETENHYCRPSTGSLSDHFTTTPSQLSIVTDGDNPAKNLTNGTSVWQIDNSAGGSALDIDFQGTTVSTTRHSIQAWVKVQSGTGGNISIDGAGAKNFNETAWTYVASEYISSPTSSSNLRVSVDAGTSILITCANMQINHFNTSLIDASGPSATRTRGRDRLIVPIDDWFNDTAGTIVIEHFQFGTVRRKSQASIYLGSGSNSNRLMLGLNTDGGHSLRCYSDGSGQVNVNVGDTVFAERLITEAMMYDATRFTASMNGIIMGRYDITALPASFAAGLHICCHPSTGAEYSSGVRQVVYYPQTMSEVELKRHTRPKTPLRLSGIPDQNRDLFLIAGQSNAVGQGSLSSLPTYTNANKMWLLGNDDHLKQFSDPYDDDTDQKDTTSSDGSPGFSFCGPMLDAYTTSTGRDSGVVPCARGSRAIDDWAPGTERDASLYMSMVRRAFLAREYGRLRALIWYQGEQDALDSTSYTTYLSKLTSVMNRLREDLEDPNFPIIIIGLHDEPTPLGSRPTWSDIQTAQSDFALPNTTFVSAAGCDVIPGDTVHLSAAGQTTLAARITPVLENLIR